MTGIEYEKGIVSLVCWKMMQAEQYRAMSMYATMLRNRAESGWFQGSIYNNAVAVGAESKLDFIDFPDAREYQFQQLLQAMDGIFSGSVPDRTGGALYCAHKSTLDQIAGETTAEIGQYIFFKG